MSYKFKLGETLTCDLATKPGVFVPTHTSVRVGESCFFGVNSSCRENIEIAEGSVIGAGTTVLRSTKSRQLLIAPEPTSLQLKQGQEDFLVRPTKQAD